MVGEGKILKVCKELKTSVLFHILHRKGGLSPSYIFLINSSRLFTLPAIVYHLLNVSSSDAVAILCLTSCGIEYISPNRSRRISVRISVRPILRPSARPSSKPAFRPSCLRYSRSSFSSYSVSIILYTSVPYFVRISASIPLSMHRRMLISIASSSDQPSSIFQRICAIKSA